MSESLWQEKFCIGKLYCTGNWVRGGTCKCNLTYDHWHKIYENYDNAPTINWDMAYDLDWRKDENI